MTTTPNQPTDEMAASRTVVTALEFSDALDCFWNASIGEAHIRQSSTAMDVACVMAAGIAAISLRLREHALAPAPDEPAAINQASEREGLIEALANVRELLAGTPIGDLGSNIRPRLPYEDKRRRATAAGQAIDTATRALAKPDEGAVEREWQPIETAWQMGDTPIIVTDGLSVFGGGWWHSGEAAWLDCGGITPTHWMPLPIAPGSSAIAALASNNVDA